MPTNPRQTSSTILVIPEQVLALEVFTTTAADNILIFFFFSLFFSKKTLRLDISCKSFSFKTVSYF